mgnify:CR=1 FL=1
MLAPVRKSTQGLRPLKQSEADHVGATVNSGYVMQTGNISHPVPMPPKFDAETALRVLDGGRALRGKDGNGLSGMTLGSYTGEYISKRSATVRDIVAVITALCTDKSRPIFVRGVDANIARDVAVNFTQQIHFEGLNVGAVRGLISAPAFPNKDGGYFINWESRPFPVKSNDTTVDNYAHMVADGIRAQAHVAEKELAFATVFRHLWLGTATSLQTIVPPSPHNLVGLFVVSKEDLKLPKITGSEFLELSIRANSYRNTFMFHRRKVWGLLTVKTHIRSPLVPYKLAGPARVTRLEDLTEDVANGVEFTIEEEFGEIFRTAVAAPKTSGAAPQPSGPGQVGGLPNLPPDPVPLDFAPEDMV